MEGLLAGAAACFFTGAMGAAAQLLWEGRKRRRIAAAQNAGAPEAWPELQTQAAAPQADAEAEAQAQAAPLAEAAMAAHSPHQGAQALLPLMPALKASVAAQAPITPATALPPAAAPPLSPARGQHQGSPMEWDEDGAAGSAGPGMEGGSAAQRRGQGRAQAGRGAAEAAADSGTAATGSPRGTLLGSQLADSKNAATDGSAGTTSTDGGDVAGASQRQRQQQGKARGGEQRGLEQAQASGSMHSTKRFKRRKPKAHEGTKLGHKAAGPAAAAAAATGGEGGSARTSRGASSARQGGQTAGKRKATGHGWQELNSLQLFAWDKHLQEQPLGREMRAVEQHIDEGLAAGEEEEQEGGSPARLRQAVHGERAYATQQRTDKAGDDDDDVEIVD